MPALKPTEFLGTITWLGLVPSRAQSLRADPLSSLSLGFAGPEGEDHGGLTRASCSRVMAQYPRNTEIANTRQLTILSAEELAQVAATIGVDDLDPALLGANMVISGIPEFTHVPPSSRLQSQSGTTVVVDMENRPCQWPAKEIEEDSPGHGKAFKRASEGKRGVTAWVERPGVLRVGDQIRLHIPDQPVWSKLSQARG